MGGIRGYGDEMIKNVEGGQKKDDDDEKQSRPKQTNGFVKSSIIQLLLSRIEQNRKILCRKKLSARKGA